jgi:hypothetical protein
MAKAEDRSLRLAADIAARLSEPWLELLADGPAAEQQFRDVDLTSVVETRCEEVVDPQHIAVPEREHWLGRALDKNEYFPSMYEQPRHCYWLRSGSQCIGAVAFLVERVRATSGCIEPPMASRSRFRAWQVGVTDRHGR